MIWKKRNGDEFTKMKCAWQSFMGTCSHRYKYLNILLPIDATVSWVVMELLGGQVSLERVKLLESL